VPTDHVCMTMPEVYVNRRPGYEVTCLDCQGEPAEAWTKADANKIAARHRRNRRTECEGFMVCQHCGDTLANHYRPASAMSDTAYCGSWDSDHETQFELAVPR
jgi:hypothetical protein